MDLGRVGVWSGELRRHAEAGTGGVEEAAAELEELGYGALFIPGRAGGDVLGAARRLLTATKRVTVATGILNIWMHDPAEVAAGRAALEAEFPERFVLGLGVSHAPLVDRTDQTYAKPLSKMRGYLAELDAADPPVPAAARLLAALGPQMLGLARDRSAGAHPYFVPVEHTAFAREALGPGPVLAPEQAVLLEADPGTARRRAREAHLGRYLELPNYTNNLLRHGLAEADLRDGGSDRLVDAIVAWGSEDDIAARVAAHRAAGADHVCVQVVGGTGEELPRVAWRRLAPVLAG